MCTADVKTLVREGTTLEKKQPDKAAQYFLKAAESLLQNQDPHREAEYIELANTLYLRATSLRKKPTIQFVQQIHNNSSFTSIGGLEEMKEELHYKIIEPFLHPEVYEYYGKEIGGGILMYGPPGCGKSLIAKAAAKEANTNFIHVKSSDLKSKFVGETEKNIADLFTKARESQPTIIFFDEFESLGGDRTESDIHNRSAVSQLLVEMDGMDAKDQSILLLAATNEPWAIDPALRREGRFGTTIYIPHPNSKAREQIFTILMKKKPHTALNFKELANQTQRFSGADIKSVCERAVDIPLKESFRTGNRRKVTMNDMILAIASTQSVLNQWYAKAKNQLQKRNLSEEFQELYAAA